MPRPTMLTPDTQTRIVEALSAGNYFDAACAYAGVTDRTGYNWMERGRDELERREGSNVKSGTKQWEKEDPFVQFFHAVTHAGAQVEVQIVAQIRVQGGDDWRALAWFMEHRYPQKWGKQVKELTGDADNPIIIQTGMSMDDL